MKTSFVGVKAVAMDYVEHSLEEAQRVWVVSDTHFDHTNIIRYCGRPFRTVDEMNSAILNNWHEAVGPRDVVYFLGDLAFGRGSRSARWWLKQLSGRIVFVKGSHDHGIRVTSLLVPEVACVVNIIRVCVDGWECVMVHDAFDAVVNGWAGWVVHGHCHDHQPFIDWQRRRVNVSVEVTGYKPVSLAMLYGQLRLKGATGS